MWTYLLLTIYKKPFLHNRVSKPDLFFTDFHFTQGDIKSFLKLGLKFYQKIFFIKLEQILHDHQSAFSQ